MSTHGELLSRICLEVQKVPVMAGGSMCRDNADATLENSRALAHVVGRDESGKFLPALLHSDSITVEIDLRARAQSVEARGEAEFLSVSGSAAECSGKPRLQS